MKHIIIGTLLLLFTLNTSIVKAEDASTKALKSEISNIKIQQEHLKKEISILSLHNKKVDRQLSNFQSTNKVFESKIDSLLTRSNALADNQKTDKSELVRSIDLTNQDVQTTNTMLSSRTWWGIGCLIVLLITITASIFSFLKKFKLGSTSIKDVRKAQETLQIAQNKMQEESIKLDNKLLELLDKQMTYSTKIVNDAQPDHSLTLKVADEIVKIELNMSRMDSSIRGYKQLAKAVEHIKDNFKANGYEIVDMLGKPYNEGMKVIANFVTDENLEEGKQIITSITKPQINYNGQMIQAAQITISQNI